MKKAWKYALAAAGIPLFCFGGLALDSYHRALSAIAAHDARLAKDIAAARQDLPPRPRDAYSFEDGHSGRSSARLRVIDAVILDSQRLPSVDLALKKLGTAQDHLREGGYAAAIERYHFEVACLRHLQALLNSRELPADALRELSRSLDRHHSDRPPPAAIITAEHLLDRAEVLNVLHQRRDPYVMIRRPPGWREFFSWRILVAKTLFQMDDLYRQVLPLGSLPVPEGERASSEWTGWNEKDGVLGRSQLRLRAEIMFRLERLLDGEWQMTRLAMAISLFQVEKGRDPRNLSELIPEYFPSLPVSPVDGAPYRYENRALHDLGLKARWLLNPR